MERYFLFFLFFLFMHDAHVHFFKREKIFLLSGRVVSSFEKRGKSELRAKKEGEEGKIHFIEIELVLGNDFWGEQVSH